MRTKLIAGNWKMNLNRAQSVELAAALAKELGVRQQCGRRCLPPAVYLDAVKRSVTRRSASVPRIATTNPREHLLGN